ncbi:MAG: class I SAM-dependent methyltransferase [Halobacteriaceae archaeon]
MPATDPAPLRAGLAAATGSVETVLDLGGGSGRAATALAGHVERVVVVDAAPGMCREARAAGHEAVCADAGRVPVRDGSVDGVVVVDALHHFPDVPGALSAVGRVLRPGGVLVVRDFDPTTVRGRALAAAERLMGFDSTFLAPRDLASAVGAAGLRPSVRERGVAFTLVGEKPGGR